MSGWLKMGRYALVAVGLVVGACATEAKYEQMLNGWLGATEIQLIEGWGVPDKTHEVDGNKFLSYVKSEEIYIPPDIVLETTVIGNTHYTRSTGGFPGDRWNLKCETTFRIADKIVAAWTVRGNDCTAR